MVSESPRTNHNYAPPRRRSERKTGFGLSLLAVLLGLSLLAGPPIVGAWLNGSFETQEIFGG